MDSDYGTRFRRNFGVFTTEQQERVAGSHVMVVGCGGVGGTVASALCRSGVESFTLVDFDVFELSNMNRQMCCFESTLGRNKAQVTAELLRSINPRVRVEVCEQILELEEVTERFRKADLVFPAADDLAYSICCFRTAQSAGVPALLVFPSGFWAVSTIQRPGGPSAETLFGVPPGLDAAGLAELFTRPVYKLSTRFFVWAGRWLPEYYERHLAGEAPLAQICPTVWLASSLGAFESIKLLSGAVSPVVLPEFWWVDAAGPRRRKLNRVNAQTALTIQRRLAWAMLRSPAGDVAEKVVWGLRKHIP